MKKFLLAGAAFAALIGPAVGSDLLPPRDRVPGYAWNGWYAGLNAGVTFDSLDVGTTSTSTFISPGGGPLAGQLGVAVASLATFDAPMNNMGFIGGGQVGYDWQFPWLATALVAGVAADIQGVSAKATSSIASNFGVFPNTLNQTASVSTGIDYLGTLRARLGMLVGFLGTTVLYYTTGGLAYGGATASTTLTQTFGGPPMGLTPPTWTGSGAFSGTRIGWTAGVGAEWLFMPNWSTSLEYLHYDLGSVTYAVSPLVSNQGVIRPFTVNAVWTNVPFNGEIIRAGVNYRF